MLVGDHVVLILGVDGLVVGGNVDVVVGELVATEVFEQVGDAAGREVDVGADRIFGLGGASARARGGGCDGRHTMAGWVGGGGCGESSRYRGDATALARADRGAALR